MSDEVLVRVDGVGKKFCRSLKKSLWYGVCDIASELNPFGRVERMPNGFKNLTTELTEDTEGRSGSNQRADSAEFLEGRDLSSKTRGGAFYCGSGLWLWGASKSSGD